MKPPVIAPITFHKRVRTETAQVTVTPAAARQILIAAEGADADGFALRIAARRNAAGAIDYAMGFDTERDGDLTLTSEGIALVVGAGQCELVDGMTLDFVEFEPGDLRFIFINPNDAGTPPPTDGAGAAP